MTNEEYRQFWTEVRAHTDDIVLANLDGPFNQGVCDSAVALYGTLDSNPPVDPDPDPDPDPGNAHHVTLGGSASSNITDLRTALFNHDHVHVDGSTIYPIDGVLDISNKTISFDVGGGLRQMRRGASGGSTSYPVLRSTGYVTNRLPLGTVSEGATTVTLNNDYGVGDWVFIQSSSAHDSIHGYDQGFLRLIVAKNGDVCTLHKPIINSMFHDVEAFKVTPNTPTIIGGIFEKAYPEDDYFDPIIEFLACEPKVVGSELRQGGASGVFSALCIVNTGAYDVYVHDLLDDHNGTDWRREANPSQLIQNPNGRRHYGYGVYWAQGNAGVGPGPHVTGTATHCRHAVSTGDSSGKQIFYDGQNGKSGHPEDIIHDMVYDSCWSTNITPHENGYGIVFSGASIDTGRYQNDFGSRDGNENSDHVVPRCDMVVRDLVCYSRPGSENGRSRGVNYGYSDMRVGSLPEPTLVIDGLQILDGTIGVDIRNCTVIVDEGGLYTENLDTLGIILRDDGSRITSENGGRWTNGGGNAGVIDVRAGSAAGLLT